MSNSLLNSLKSENNWKETENGATALSSTLSPLVDLFGEIGALRERTEEDIISLFTKAYAADPLLALRTLFYTRDIRGGLGERRTFRVILKYLAANHPNDVRVNMHLIPEYGRWDDLYTLVGTPLETDAFELIAMQFNADMADIKSAEIAGTTPHVSLLGKWLKSENASSQETARLGAITRQALGLSSRDYRKALTTLRKAIDVVEVKMSASEWIKIDYPSVPAIASTNYRAAFLRHDQPRYFEFITQVQEGTAKINASTLYPYDIVRQYLHKPDRYGTASLADAALEAQWHALPNYITPDKDFLIMADTSGSMYSNNDTPISTSVGLAIYFAERSTGAFANHFITFTDVPTLQEISPNLTLGEKINQVTSNCGYNTNLEAAFQLVLDSAISGKVAPEDMPTAIVVISDMEIDDFGEPESNVTFTEEMRQRFAEAGYIMPTLVYWNVDARANTFHALADDPSVRFVSGSSPAVFAGLCNNLGYSALELILAVLNSQRYGAVTLPE